MSEATTQFRATDSDIGDFLWIWGNFDQPARSIKDTVIEKMFEKNKKQEKKPRKTSVYVVDTYYERQKLLNLITKKNIWNTQEIYIKVFCKWVNTIIKENKRIQNLCGGFCLVKETIR